jgi:two-component system phosphate regulon sensor histidine kinase PhoR
MRPGEANKHLSVAERFAALSHVGVALMGERDEKRSLHLIAETARDLTGASFAAFTLRPVDGFGRPTVPSEGHLFYLAAVVGVSEEQEALFRSMPLGGVGLLAPIFRYGVPVLVKDVLAQMQEEVRKRYPSETQESARDVALAYAHGQLPSEKLHYMGVPRGHPIIRSFLGAPLLDRANQVLGGLLLGHGEPGKFTKEDETLLVGLAAQAAVALENARLYRTVEMRAQELGAIFESISDGVTVVDREGKVFRENQTARHLREHIASLPDGEHILNTLLQSSVEQLLREETKQGISRLVSGMKVDERDYVINASPLCHTEGLPFSSSELTTDRGISNSQDTMVGAVIVWHDVTEARHLLIERRVHAETEARRALLHLILDQLPGSVYLVRGVDAQLVLANRAAETLWGAQWQQGMPMRDFLSENGIRIFGIDGRPLPTEQLATYRAVQRGETVRHHQEIIRHSDGTALPVLVNAVALKARELSVVPTSALHLTDESELAAIVMHQDVTALKEAERLKDEFIGIAAHELRNPLAVLKGYAQTLIVQTARGRGSELADWQMEALQSIDQATTRLTELTEDLLDVTRLQAGRLTLHIEPVNLVALTQRVMARLQMTTTQHTLSFSSISPHLVVFVDPRRVEQVLTNLINNAVKYSPDGGPIELKIVEETTTNTVVLSIRDYGIGIPAQQQMRIFGRFVRADNAHERGIGGTGLGLYLCRELVERQGGRIWFGSVEGKGSTFYVALPYVSRMPSSSQEEEDQ